MTDFQKWLHKNHSVLRGYGSDQIAYFALMNGFPREEIYGNVCDHVTHIKRLLTFWENPLIGNWLSLCNYERGIDQ